MTSAAPKASSSDTFPPSVAIRSEFLTGPDASLELLFYSLDDLDLQTLLPQGNQDAESWWEKSKLSEGHLEHLTSQLLITFPVIYTAESEVPGE